MEVRVENFGETRCLNPQKPETDDWEQEFRENLVDKNTSTDLWGNTEQGNQDTSSHFVIFHLSREQKWNHVGP